jgi:hypothetical protein
MAIRDDPISKGLYIVQIKSFTRQKLAINEANSKYCVKNSLKPIISFTASSWALGQI